MSNSKGGEGEPKDFYLPGDSELDGDGYPKGAEPASGATTELTSLTQLGRKAVRELMEKGEL